MSRSGNRKPISDWLEGSILATSVTVGTVAVPLPATSLANRRYIDIYNGSGQTIYLGDATVTTGHGRTLLTGESKDYWLDAGNVIWGIAAQDNLDVRCLEGS